MVTGVLPAEGSSPQRCRRRNVSWYQTQFLWVTIRVFPVCVWCSVIVWLSWVSKQTQQLFLTHSFNCLAHLCTFSTFMHFQFKNEPNSMRCDLCPHVFKEVWHLCAQKGLCKVTWSDSWGEPNKLCRNNQYFFRFALICKTVLRLVNLLYICVCGLKYDSSKVTHKTLHTFVSLSLCLLSTSYASAALPQCLWLRPHWPG